MKKGGIIAFFGIALVVIVFLTHYIDTHPSFEDSMVAGELILARLPEKVKTCQLVPLESFKVGNYTVTEITPRYGCMSFRLKSDSGLRYRCEVTSFGSEVIIHLVNVRQRWQVKPYWKDTRRIVREVTERITHHCIQHNEGGDSE